MRKAAHLMVASLILGGSLVVGGCAQPPRNDAPDSKDSGSNPDQSVQADSKPVIFHAAITAPQQNPSCRPPDESRSAHETGTAEVLLVVTNQGNIARVELVRTSGYDRLDETAKRCLLSFRVHLAPSVLDRSEFWLYYAILFKEDTLS